jgi:hypothetical protein
MAQGKQPSCQYGSPLALLGSTLMVGGTASPLAGERWPALRAGPERPWLIGKGGRDHAVVSWTCYESAECLNACDLYMRMVWRARVAQQPSTIARRKQVNACHESISQIQQRSSRADQSRWGELGKGAPFGARTREGLGGSCQRPTSVLSASSHAPANLWQAV